MHWIFFVSSILIEAHCKNKTFTTVTKPPESGTYDIQTLSLYISTRFNFSFQSNPYDAQAEAALLVSSSSYY